MVKEENDKRNNLLHIAFSQNELDEIDDYVSKSSHATRTSFIREAILEKIMRIENPEKFGKVSSLESQVKEIQEQQKKQMELQQLLLQRLTIVNGINETVQSLKPLISKEEIAKHCKTIVSMLKVYKTISIDKLILLTQYDKKTIYDCISSNSKLHINDQGEVYIIDK